VVNVGDDGARPRDDLPARLPCGQMRR
jgi:hypothetical protein